MIAALILLALLPLQDIRAAMQAALDLLAAGEEERAVPLLLSVVDQNPNHGPARLQLGALALERGEWAVAADHLQVAVAPASVRLARPALAWHLLGEALDRLDRPEEALDATDRSLEIAPEYVPALLAASRFSRRLGRLEKALAHARAAVGNAPEAPRPFQALALAADAARADELAACAAREAVRLGDGAPEFQALLGALLQERAPEEAEAALEIAVGAGGEAAAWLALGNVRAAGLRLPAALAAYAEALRRDPGVAGSIASVALDALASDPETRTLLESSPDAGVRFALAKDLLARRGPAAALPSLRELAAAAPGHVATLATLHAALRAAGETAEADRVLERLAAAKRAEAEAWDRRNRIEQLRRDGRWREVLDAAGAEAAAADWRNLGLALGEDPEAALPAFREALRLDPFDREALEGAAALAAPEAAARFRRRAALLAPACRPERRVRMPPVR